MDKYSIRATVGKVAFWDTFFIKNKNGKIRPSIRFYRYFTMTLAHVLFILSFKMDIQILEGNISASRIFGLHLADIFTTIEIFLVSHKLPINLAIGSFTILIFYALFGGRAFCSWVCPYNFLGEIGERLNAVLIKKRIIKKRELKPWFRYFF